MSLVEESSFEDCIIFVLYWLLCQVKSTSFRLVLTMPVRDVRKHRDLHLERKHVYNVYDQIAPKFSEISQKAWPNVRRFLKDLPPGSVVADIGSWIKICNMFWLRELNSGFNEIIRMLVINMSYIIPGVSLLFLLIWV